MSLQLGHDSEKLRKDSQIDFAAGNVIFLARLGGGGLHKNVSQILTIINFSSRKIAGKTLSVRKNIVGIINSDQTIRLNLDRFGIGSDFPDCRLAPLA